MKIKNLILIVFVLISLSSKVNSQSGFELGGWIGISNYSGELSSGYNLANSGVAGGGNLRFLFNDRLSLKTSLNYARVGASDANSSNSFNKKRNLSFKSNIFDLTNQFEFNFIPYVHGSEDFFSPYILTGFSIFYYNPKAEYEGKWYSLRELGTEGQSLGEEYFQFSSALVVGGGFKWDISTVLSMNIEMSYRFLFTDYLDDVSTVYPNIRELESLRGKVAVKLSDKSEYAGFAQQGKQRGDSRDNDKMSFIGVSMMYYFGSLKCPPINRYQ